MDKGKLFELAAAMVTAEIKGGSLYRLANPQDMIAERTHQFADALLQAWKGFSGQEMSEDGPVAH